MKNRITVFAAILLIAAVLVGCSADTGNSKTQLVTVGLGLTNEAESASKYLSATATEQLDLSSIQAYKIIVTDVSNNAYRYIDLKIGSTPASVTDSSKKSTSGAVTTYTLTKAELVSPTFVLSQGVWKFEVKAFSDSAATTQIGYGATENTTISNATQGITVYLAQDYGNSTATLTVKLGGETPSASACITTPASVTATYKRFAVIIDSETITSGLTEDFTDSANHKVYGTVTKSVTATPANSWHTVSLVYQQSTDNSTWTSLRVFPIKVNVLKERTITISGTFTEGQFSSGDTLTINSHYVTIDSLNVSSPNVSATVKFDGAAYSGTPTYAWTIGGEDAGTSATVSFTGKDAGDYVVNCKVTITQDGVAYSVSAWKTVRWANGTLTAAN